MSKVLFFSLPAYGHTMPTIPVAQELKRRGFDVIYYSTPKFHHLFKEQDIAVRYYAADNNFFNLFEMEIVRCLKKNLIAELWLAILRYSEKLIDYTLAEIAKEKPDLIIHDTIANWGKIGALRSNTKAVCSIPIYILSAKIIARSSALIRRFCPDYLKSFRHLLTFRRQKKIFAEKYSLTSEMINDVIYNFEPLNIVYTSRYFQELGGRFNDHFKFIGASIDKKNETTQNKKRII